mmetsp:Transcript_27382/g.57838  ORF Transcript_27382/g.57838 Transcript_27382/m.57838 type:complete len:422 (-) Transcript_27382:157-1422(-)
MILRNGTQFLVHLVLVHHRALVIPLPLSHPTHPLRRRVRSRDEFEVRRTSRVQHHGIQRVRERILGVVALGNGLGKVFLLEDRGSHDEEVGLDLIVAQSLVTVDEEGGEVGIGHFLSEPGVVPDENVGVDADDPIVPVEVLVMDGLVHGHHGPDLLGLDGVVPLEKGPLVVAQIHHEIVILKDILQQFHGGLSFLGVVGREVHGHVGVLEQRRLGQDVPPAVAKVGLVLVAHVRRNVEQHATVLGNRRLCAMRGVRHGRPMGVRPRRDVHGNVEGPRQDVHGGDLAPRVGGEVLVGVELDVVDGAGGDHVRDLPGRAASVAGVGVPAGEGDALEELSVLFGVPGALVDDLVRVLGVEAQAAEAARVFHSVVGAVVRGQVAHEACHKGRGHKYNTRSSDLLLHGLASKTSSGLQCNCVRRLV